MSFKAYILTVVFLCFFAGADAQIIAKIESDTTAGCAPLQVNFKDKSIGNVNKWKWYFGNGNFSSLQNPSSSYLIAGKYNVKLIVEDTVTHQKDSVVSISYIRVFKNP